MPILSLRLRLNSTKEQTSGLEEYKNLMLLQGKKLSVRGKLLMPNPKTKRQSRPRRKES
jgi:hypothetical protein